MATVDSSGSAATKKTNRRYSKYNVGHPLQRPLLIEQSRGDETESRCGYEIARGPFAVNVDQLGVFSSAIAIKFKANRFTQTELKADGDADSLVSVMAFGSTADQLAAMGKGDAVAINGRAKVNTWSGRDGETKAGLSVTADAVMSAYHLKRKRQAVAESQERTPQRQAAPEVGFGAGADTQCRL